MGRWDRGGRVGGDGVEGGGGQGAKGRFLCTLEQKSSHYVHMEVGPTKGVISGFPGKLA